MNTTLITHDRALLDQTLLPEFLFHPTVNTDRLRRLLKREGHGELTGAVSVWLESHLERGTIIETENGFTLRKDQAEIVYLGMSWCKSFGWGQNTFAQDTSVNQLVSEEPARSFASKVLSSVSEAWASLTRQGARRQANSCERMSQHTIMSGIVGQ